MPTVHRAGNLRFMIYLEDHGPPHVHVFAGGAEAKVLLGPPNGRPVREWMRGFDRAGLNRVFKEVVARQAQFQREASCCVAADPWSGGMKEVQMPVERAVGKEQGWSKEEIDRALAKGRRLAATEPRAERARYDRRTGRVVVELTNGCSFMFPARALQGMARASDAELADIEIMGIGFGLHWPALDADFTVPGLLMGVFGTRAWMASELARRAGQTKSKAKAAAARVNGRKGGRPRRAA